MDRSHAPRERVSWNIWKEYGKVNLGVVTLHVSVWVEIDFDLSKVGYKVVTLHVSVWVEINVESGVTITFFVTLHVSVWVEIYFGTQYSKSRGHAPRERVSWNRDIFPEF